MQQRSFQYLTSLEDDSKKGLALEAVQKNPRLLTVPIYEYERTKPSLAPCRNAVLSFNCNSVLRPQKGRMSSGWAEYRRFRH